MVRGILIRDVLERDRDRILAIFSHYATTGFAAYPEVPPDDRFFSFLREGSLSFKVLESRSDSKVVGFGLVKPLLPFPAFAGTGMVTYFIAPEFTGQGLGARLLEQITDDAKALGMSSLVANISSKNPGSIRFHEQNGFLEVGRLRDAGKKFRESFDLVWMQKML